MPLIQVYRQMSQGCLGAQLRDLHHLCFKCDNMDTELSWMKNQGMRILVEPQPGEAFENENIAFVFPATV